MPLHFIRDEQKQRFFVTLTGDVTLDELASFVAGQITAGSWHFSVLYDAMAPGVTLKPLESTSVEIWRELSSQYGARGYVAFAVGDDRQRAVAVSYASDATATGTFTAAVFSDVGAAEEWLNARGPVTGKDRSR
jgi:hypothetical protein